MIFIHIQRTGGNSISAALGETPWASNKHLTALELRDRCDREVWDTYFKFSFVRNPWDRLVSWWSLIEGHRAAYESGATFNNFQTFILSRAREFEQFVNECDQEIIDVDGKKSIYKNQLDYLTDEHGRLLVDFVGRFENIQNDFSFVTQKMLGRALVLPRSNYTVHNHYSKYYDFALRDIVAARFGRDIEEFGYTFENENASNKRITSLLNRLVRRR